MNSTKYATSTTARQAEAITAGSGLLLPREHGATATATLNRDTMIRWLAAGSAQTTLIFGLSTMLAFAMGDAPEPDLPTSPCIQGEAVTGNGAISRCQWANAHTGWNSVRLEINPDKPHSGRSKGEILNAYFSTRMSLCDDQSDTECLGRPDDLIGLIIGNGATFRFKAGSDTFMEGKIKAFTSDGVTYFGFGECTCR
ncbi:hypothetical protein Thiowin_03786 [Thiorhodovibrio winogradskyi]|uniref:Uncharacterized protein n=1 Tax=Thiorhodovibrio winogradskyi TaxID=77007 RepID=A0ABZ0SDV2_9GAMM|nr:hypothetical protein [Thiorhodovibrio winogradskyi]